MAASISDCSVCLSPDRCAIGADDLYQGITTLFKKLSANCVSGAREITCVFKDNLAATDEAERSERALELGVDLVRASGARITAVMAMQPIPETYVECLGRTVHNEELEQNARDFAMQCLAVAGNAARAAGVAFETVHVIDTRPHEAITRTAEANHCDLIVMASHGRSGADAVLLCSETQKVRNFRSSSAVDGHQRYSG